jgi:RNA polymerase sigma-70 factor, ECF subfamily
MQLTANGPVDSPADGPRMDRSEELMSRIAASQKALFAYIRTLVGPSGDVDDILQEVNLVLWRRGDDFEGRGEFLSWACHVAHLQVLAHFQRRRRERHFYFDEGALTDLADCVAAEVERIDARLEALRGCLARLSPSQRRMILSRYEQGGSVEKVAGELDRPAGSVRVSLHRLRQLLADCIERTLARGGGP